MTVELGDIVKHTITGFKGTAISEHKYISGCRRIGVQPAAGKDGKLPEAHTFDEPELEIVKKKNPEPKPRKKPGGPKSYSDSPMRYKEDRR